MIMLYLIVNIAHNIFQQLPRRVSESFFYNDERVPGSQGTTGFWEEGTSILLVRMRLKLPAFVSGSQLSLQNQTLRVGTYACRWKWRGGHERREKGRLRLCEICKRDLFFADSPLWHVFFSNLSSQVNASLYYRKIFLKFSKNLFEFIYRILVSK